MALIGECKEQGQEPTYQEKYSKESVDDGGGALEARGRDKDGKEGPRGSEEPEQPPPERVITHKVDRCETNGMARVGGVENVEDDSVERDLSEEERHKGEDGCRYEEATRKDITIEGVEASSTRERNVDTR